MEPDWSSQIITIYLIGQFKPVKWYDITSRVSFLFTALSHWYPHIICIIKFSTSDNAFRVLSLVHSILVISSYTLVWPYMANGWDVTNTGKWEPGTGVWEQVYSGNPLENSKWRSKQKEGSNRNSLGKGEFPPAVPPDDQYVLVLRAESD